MSYVFKVKVLCVGTKPGKKAGRKLERYYMHALVEADNLDGAMAAGVSFADAYAPPHALWREFTTLEASRVVFPANIGTL